MKCVAYDTETTGFYPWKGDDMFAYSTCDADEKYDVVRLDGRDGADTAKCNALLSKFWSDKRIAKVMHNSKFDLKFTEKALGRRLAEDHPFHDTYLQSHIMQNTHPSHRLKDLCWELFGIGTDDELKVKKYVTATKQDYSHVPVDIMNEYQHLDAVRAMLLHMFFYPKIQASAQLTEIYETEIDLVRTTLRMEERGIYLNRPRCEKLYHKMKKEADEILDEAAVHLGRRRDLGNDNQVRLILFTQLGMEPVKRTKKGNQPAVDKESLDELGALHQNPILDLILRYRSRRTGASMLAGYLDHADANGIIHPDIHTCQAKTARESCSKPNLQNVQKDKSFRNRFPVPARDAFGPRPGYVNFHLDYSGIEFRIAVELTGDEKLIDMAARGEDLHSIGAAILYGDEWTRADKDLRALMRGSGKNANFAKMYGAGLRKVSQTLGREIDQSVFKQYDEVFGALDSSAARITRKAREERMVYTRFGRPLNVPANKPYIGTNYEIQGSAAEVVKRAQNRVHHYLEEVTSGEAGLLLPIHDEIIFEYPRSRMSDVYEILGNVRSLMTDFPQFNVPLDVDIEVTTSSWMKKKKFKLD